MRPSPARRRRSARGFTGVDEVRQGKFIEIELQETDAARARTALDAMCRQLLANAVIENYSIVLG